MHNLSHDHTGSTHLNYTKKSKKNPLSEKTTAWAEKRIIPDVGQKRDASTNRADNRLTADVFADKQNGLGRQRVIESRASLECKLESTADGRPVRK